jgi:hypothetical protein
MGLEECKTRLEELEKAIAEASGWGAALSVMDEEARSLRETIAWLESEEASCDT